ncbi:MAG: hypothetical protein WKF73_16720 [Nocardioidaceae bacterium]
MRASITLSPNAPALHGNLAELLRVTEGLAAALHEVEEAIRLATAQGSRVDALTMQQVELDLLFDLGRWEELVERAPALISQLSEIEDDYAQASVEVRMVRALLLRRDPDGESAASCLQRARRIGDPQVLLPALVVAGSAAALAGDRDELARLLGEIESDLDSVGEAIRPLYLPEITRLAVWSQDLQLAERLIETTRPTTPASLAGQASAQAALREATEDLDQAISHYSDAVERWTALGHVVERAYGLLGLGRCRLAAGDLEGVDDALAARDIFAGLRAQPLIAEADRLLTADQCLSSRLNCHTATADPAERTH